ncbi:MAG: hypothetical protein R3C61_05355 [Bacteroidia bacterium]
MFTLTIFLTISFIRGLYIAIITKAAARIFNWLPVAPQTPRPQTPLTYFF